jgi:hypothetical protein
MAYLASQPVYINAGGQVAGTEAEMQARRLARATPAREPNRVTQRVLDDILAGRNIATYPSIEALAAAARSSGRRARSSLVSQEGRSGKSRHPRT